MTRSALLLSFTMVVSALVLLGAAGEARGDWYDVSFRIGGSGPDHRYSVSLNAGSEGLGSRGRYSLSINLGSDDRYRRDYRPSTPWGLAPPAGYVPYAPNVYVPVGFAYRPYAPRTVIVGPRGRAYGPPYGMGAYMRHEARHRGPGSGFVEMRDGRDNRGREADSWRPYDLPGRR